MKKLTVSNMLTISALIFVIPLLIAASIVTLYTSSLKTFGSSKPVFEDLLNEPV